MQSNLTTARRLAAYRDELVGAGFSEKEARKFVRRLAPSEYLDLAVQADPDGGDPAVGGE